MVPDPNCCHFINVAVMILTLRSSREEADDALVCSAVQWVQCAVQLVISMEAENILMCILAFL